MLLPLWGASEASESGGRWALTSWEVASDLVRGWDAAGRIGEVKPDLPTAGGS